MYGLPYYQRGIPVMHSEVAPYSNTSAKEKDKAKKIELAKMAAQALVHKDEQRRAQEQAKKEKQRKGKKVVHFNL